MDIFPLQDSEYSHSHFDGVLIDLIMQEIKDDKLPDEGAVFVK